MDSVVRSVRLLWRAEMMLVQIRLRIAVRKLGLVALAALIALFGLVMINVAAYVGLSTVVGPVWGAVIVAAVDFLIALILILIAQGLRPGPEIEVAEEVRALAIAELEAEAKEVQADIAEIRAEIEGIKKAIVGFARNPMDAIGGNVLLPLLTSLVKLLRGK